MPSRTEFAAPARVRVIVLNWNGLELTRACVRSLLAQTFRALEIVVVDNGSSGGEAEALRREFGDAIAVLALPQNAGFTGGCNAALEPLLRGGCEFAALLNNDAEAEPRWVEALVRCAEQDARIGAVSSRMRLHDRPDLLDNAGAWLLGSGDPMPRGRAEPAAAWDREEDLLTGCGGALLLRTSMLAEIGLFRADFFANFEDADLLLRARVAGWRVRYAPAAEVRHRLNATIARVRDHEFDVRSVRNATWAWAVNLPWPVLLLNLPWFLLANLGLVLLLPLCGRTAAARAFASGRLRALRELPRLLAERRRLRPLRRERWWRLWWAQRSTALACLDLLRQRRRGRLGLMARAAAARGAGRAATRRNIDD